jgi:hypothetical protein
MKHSYCRKRCGTAARGLRRCRRRLVEWRMSFPVFMRSLLGNDTADLGGRQRLHIHGLKHRDPNRQGNLYFVSKLPTSWMPIAKRATAGIVHHLHATPLRPSACFIPHFVAHPRSTAPNNLCSPSVHQVLTHQLHVLVRVRRLFPHQIFLVADHPSPVDIPASWLQDILAFVL